MSLIDDLSNAIDAYAKEKVVITIPEDRIDVEGVINEDDIAEFYVNVANSGHLNMMRTQIHITASKFVLVSAPLKDSKQLGDFKQSVVSAPEDVTAHGSMDFGPYRMLALTQTDDSVKLLIKASIATFDADLAHVLRGHSHRSGAPVGIYSAEIHPI